MNYTLLCDFYELTMGNGYFQTEGYADQICYFDVFFRNVPDGGGFAIAAGLEQVISYIENLRFTEEDITYLRGKGCFCEEFLNYLRGFRFTGDIWAVPEGTPIFPREPILTVRAPAIEAQFIETFLLLTLNHQSLIATKTNRIVRAAGDDVAFTLDTHGPDYLDTQEGRKLPVPHCLRGSDGWQLYGETGQALDRGRDKVLEKPAFPSLELAEWLRGRGYDQVELAGLVSYLCVLSNAVMVKAALPEAEIIVDASCTAGPDPALHAKGLDVMEALQITVLNR